MNKWARNCAGLLLALLIGCSAAPQSGSVALTHATVIDTTGGPAKPDCTVIITGDRITAMGASAQLQPPTNAVVVDATGKFLIPGLWDMHVHWYEEDYLPLFIANGVTGVRIMWGYPVHHEWRERIAQGKLLGPHLLLASTIVDGPKPYWPGSLTAANAAEGRIAVTKARKEEADFVKVYSGLPRDAYFAIADEAKKKNIPFAGHVPEAVSAAEASAAGQKSIEHLTGVITACSTEEAELLRSAESAIDGALATNQPGSLAAHTRHDRAIALQTYSAAKAEALFAEFKKNQTWQCPTLTVLHNLRYIDDASVTNDARVKYMPSSLRDSWNPQADFRFKGRNAASIALGKQIYQKETEIVGAMQRAGVYIIAGTDTGNPYCFPGFSLHDELGLLVQAGLTPLQALQTATLNPAHYMDCDKDLGTVETGKLADLVLLDANPLDDIANTKKISAVIYNGRLYPKPALDEMLTRIEALAR